jgi:tetratricopeptide (TPR) repeat protein
MVSTADLQRSCPVNANEAPKLMIEKAASLRREGRLVEAVAAYEEVLKRWPELAECWYNLALLQRQTGRFAPALAAYQQALDRGAKDPEEIHLNRGVIYADCLRDDAAAERELNAALRIQPNYVPAILNLANLKEDQGDKDKARAFYERVLRLDAGNADALARLAYLSTVAAPDDPLIAKLKRALARPGIGAAERATLGFALGKALNDCAAYDEAFAAYVAANRNSRASAGPEHVPYDRGNHEQFIADIILTFARNHLTAPPTDAKPPIFICGMFRSGSTLVEQVLASHPRVTAGGEMDFMPALVRTELRPFPAAMVRTTRGKLAEIAARYRAFVSKVYPNADVLTDKRPDNFLYIGLIKTLFPNAKIIHTKRDALDNCLSAFFLHADLSVNYAVDLMDIGHYYGQQERLMAHWKSLYGADILEFDYDAFVREPRPAAEKLLAFCGLDWNEDVLAFHKTKNAVKTASVWQVRQPLYAHASGRWRNYAKHVDELKSYLQKLEGDARRS